MSRLPTVVRMVTTSRSRGRPRHPDVLTPAEWRVAHAVRNGMSNRMIARRQGVTVDAIKFHLQNILDKLGLAGRAQLQAWEGIPLDSALQHSEQVGESVVEALVGAIGQVSRSVINIDIAVAWYRDVLGLPYLYSFVDLAFLDVAGTRLFLTAVEDAVDEPGESVLYFRVGDIHAVRDALSNRGVVSTAAPHLIHKHESGVEEWMAFFTDPDGNTLALMMQTPPASTVATIDPA